MKRIVTTALAAAAMLFSTVGTTMAQSTPQRVTKDCIVITADDRRAPLDIKFFPCPKDLATVAWPARWWLRPEAQMQAVTRNYMSPPRKGEPLDLNKFRQ